MSRTEYVLFQSLEMVEWLTFALYFARPYLLGPSVGLFLGYQPGIEEIRPALLLSGAPLVVPVVADDPSRASLEWCFDAE